MPVSLSLSQATTVYAHHLATQGQAPAAVKGQSADLSLLVRALQRHAPGITLATLTPKVLELAFLDLSAPHHSTGSLRALRAREHVLATVQDFCAWAVDVGLLAEDPTTALSLQVPTAPMRAPMLTAAEIQAIRQTLDDRADVPYGGRDRVMLECLLTTGIRISELTQLTVEDVDLDHQRLCVGRGQPHERVLPLATALCLRLTRFLAWRTAHQHAETTTCFVSGWGHRLSTGKVTALVGTWLQQAGLGAHITPLSFRATFATRVFHRTHDLLLVRRILGVGSAEMAMRYIDRSCDSLEAVVEEFAQ